MIGARSINMMGKTCGRLSVIKFAFFRQYPSTKNIAYWHCRCGCGNEKDVDGRNLRNGVTQSCGCLSKETNSKRVKGIPFTAEHKRKISDAHKGKKHSEEHKRKNSEAKIGLYSGEKNPNWSGGVSFEPYSPSFNQQLKERVRVRDNFICPLWGITELECNTRLPVHYIDYDKANAKPENLITLCQSCHSKTCFDRKYWQKRFKNFMEAQNYRSISC